MMGCRFAPVALILCLAGPARAEDRQQLRVRAGGTTVTVIDEGESVDDVISRVREARVKKPDQEAPKALPGPPTEKSRPQTQGRDQKRAERIDTKREEKQQQRQEKLHERRLERRRQDLQGTRRKRG